MKNHATIVVSESRQVRTITLNRPERRNALTPEMQSELIAAFEDAASSGCRALVLTGAGDAFCSGLDLAELQSVQKKSFQEHRADAQLIARLFLSLYELPIPTISAVHGPAIAGGTGLATICDFTLASPEAKFGFTEVRIGFVPAFVSAFLTLELGRKQSMDLLLSGRIFGADEAQRIGLVNEVVPREQLAGRTKALAEALLANSPQAMRATKQLLIAQNKEWLSAAVAEATEAGAEARTTSDFREGIAAFLEKRKPAWRG